MNRIISCRLKTPRGDLCDQYRKKTLEIHSYRISGAEWRKTTVDSARVKQFSYYTTSVGQRNM